MENNASATNRSSSTSVPSGSSNIDVAISQSESQNNKVTHPHPALATSKRKFHQILENLTKPSPSVDSRHHSLLSTFADSPAKRIRLEARSRLEARNVPTDAHTAHIQSQLLKSRLEAARASSKTSQRPDSSTPKFENRGSSVREPNYMPGSQDAFLRRLKTFADVSLWSTKPNAVNEVAWARRGWVCVGYNTVSCRGGCDQRVYVSLRPSRRDEKGQEIINSEDLSVEIDDELVKRVAGLVVSGHDEDCLWRTSGCREDVYRLPIARSAIWQPQLRERYLSFTSLESNLPLSSNLLHPIDISSIISLLPSGLLSRETQNQPDPNLSAESSHTALALALFGWSANTETPDYPLATCSYCFRRIGLWLYNQSQPEPKLDLLENHRDYCPWINAESQAMPGTMARMPAWQILRQSIENDAGFRGAATQPLSGRFASPPPTQTEEGHSNKVEGPASPAISTRSKEEIEMEDTARFAKLRELSKAIGLKRLGLRDRPGRLKAGKT